MSLKLNERYPGRFNNPSADYPQGSFKNRTSPSAKDGSYLEKDWANDKEGFFQSLLSAAGIAANGAVDAVGASQFFDALQRLKQIQAGTAFTTAGRAGVLTLAPVPAITAYVAPQRFRLKFNQASIGNDTLNVSGQGAKSIKQYDSTGAKVAAVFAANQLADVEYDGTDMVVLDPLPSRAVQATESAAGVAKVATQALTNAGVDDTTIVTPKKLFAAQKAALVQATESAAGVAKVATQALTNAGVDDATIVTPKKLFSGVLSALGFTPVQQGGGIGQSNNTLKIGWSSSGEVKVTVDSTDKGAIVFKSSLANSATIPASVSVTANQLVLRDGSGSINAMRHTGTGTGNDFGSGAFEACGNGQANTIFPTYGFHQPGMYAATLQLREANTFAFIAQNNADYADVRARRFYSTGSVNVGGSGILGTDGNIYGSIWGGWLNDYITNKVTDAIATTLGYNQTWQNVTANRVLATTYTNTTGRPIQVLVDFRDSGAPVPVKFNIDGISWDSADLPGANRDLILWSFVIPAGGSYSLSGGLSVRSWLELR